MNVEILTRQQLHKEVQQIQASSPHGRVYLFDDLRYFSIEDFNYHHRDIPAWYHITRDEKSQRITAMLKLEQNPNEENEMWLNFVSVSLSQRNKGLATQLLHSAFSQVAQMQKTLSVSTYTYLGGKFLPSVVAKLKQQFPALHVESYIPKHSNPTERDLRELGQSPEM